MTTSNSSKCVLLKSCCQRVTLNSAILLNLLFICKVVNSDSIPKDTILLFKCILETVWKMITP